MATSAMCTPAISTCLVAHPIRRLPHSPTTLRSTFLPAGNPPGGSLHRHPRANVGLSASRIVASISTKSKGPDLMASIAGFFKRILPQGPAEEPPQHEEEVPEKGGRQVAVLGGTGRTGKLVVAKLLEEGHRVTVLASSTDRAKEVLEEGLGLRVGGDGAKAVKVVEGRVQDPDALRALMQGNDCVICCLGSRRGPEGYEPGMSPQDVDWKGLREAVSAASAGLEADGSSLAQGDVYSLVDFSQCQEAADASAAASGGGGLFDEGQRLIGWQRRDDVIMGGQSESLFRAGNGYAVFEGLVRVDGGGFCGTGLRFAAPVDASAYDGFRIRVRGDGRRYKINARDASQAPGELQYQASFDTVRGRWVDVFVPFTSFQAVQKAYFVPGIRPLYLTELAGVQFVHSKFQFNGFPNPLFEPGPFRLEVESIALERKPRTQFVLLSSAAVERSSRAQTPEEREASIPIVKLNPVGVLSWKLSGEDALRASGLRYTVVRPCGLTDKDEDQPFLLESAQGDVITGLISREEAAAVLVESLQSPYASNVTFEVRRDEPTKGLSMSARHWSSLFGRLRPDVPAPIVQYPDSPQELLDTNKE